jgi:beta-lactamase regulating signal transducer with metallopeptidase domain
MSEEFYTACQRLVIATANGVYQGIIVAAIAGLCLRLFARTNAATRHAVWFGVLLLVTALIPAHLLVSSFSRPETPPSAIQPASSLASVTPLATDSHSIAASLNADFDVLTPPTDNDDTDVTGGTLDSSASEPTQVTTAGELDSNSRSDAAATGQAWRRFTPALLRPSSWNLQTPISLPHSICLALVFAWVLLASVRSGLIVGRMGEVRRVKRSSTTPSDGLRAVFERLRGSLAARRNVQLKTSSMHRAAVVLGFVHPVVLLPAEMDKEDANADEVEHVMRHELAHVSRRDDWGNLAQQMIQAALFFHPAVWWISTKLSLEREIACDDHVLEASGRPRDYALTLANVASRMNHCRHLLAPGVSNNNSQLQQRITMILNTQRDRSPRLARSRLGLFTTATAIIAVIAITAGPRLVLAQTSAFSSAPAAASSDTFAPQPLQEAPVANALPATQPPDWSDSESGPRLKSPTSANVFSQPNAPASSVTTVAPAAPGYPVMPAMPGVAAMPPMAANEASPDVAPVPPEPPARPGKRHLSIEERLDRIERMLDDLKARDDGKGRHRSDDGASSYGRPDRQNAPAAMPVNPNFDIQITPNFDFQFKRAAEEAQKAAEQERRAAEQGQREAEKAMRDLERLKSKDFERFQDDLRTAESEGPARALEALRTARQSLQQQMQSLERQIKQLEADQKQRKEQGHGKSDYSPDETPKSDQPAPEK